MKPIDIRFPARSGSSVKWKFSDYQISFLTKKFGDATLRKVIVPKIRARVRTWYGVGSKSWKGNGENVNWLVKVDAKLIII